MNKYKYQMHAHTRPCSDCSAMYPEELMSALAEGGYSGCVITNHFMHGNTGIPRRIPWEDFVREYELDFLECKKYAEIYGVDVIFGVEEGIGDGLEILCYGITPEVLYEHPELRYMDAEIWYEVMDSCGALCIQAHPFRDRPYIREPLVLPPGLIDGIEVFNYENTYEENLRAKEFASEFSGLILVSGADTHIPETACRAGIETNRRITNEKELVEVLVSGEYSLIEE